MAFQGDSIFWVEVEKIVENPFQPRRVFDDAKLQELSESIRMYGILQPLTVTRREIQNEDGSFRSEYELIAGERRLRASKLAKLEQVPVIIRSGEQTEQEKLELAIIENLQREDLNAVDRALAFQQLAEAFKLSHAQVAKKVGRSREYVSNSIRLLQLPECMQNSLKLGDISEGHARTLLMLKDRPEEQDVVYREILLKKLSVREVERITRKIAADKVRKKKWNNTDAELIAIEKEFTDTLGTRVQISKTDFGGKLTIDYFSDDDLQKLLELMKREREQEAAGEDETSTTVIHELSPEASLAAKLSQAVPIDFAEDNDLSQSDDSRHSIPQVEDRPFGASYSDAPPEIPMDSVATEAEMAPPVQVTESTLAPAEQLGPAQPTVAETSETSEVEVPEPAVPSNEQLPQEESAEVSAEHEHVAPVAPIAPVDDTNAQSDEFAFITQHTPEATKEDLVNPYQQENHSQDLSHVNTYMEREGVVQAESHIAQSIPEEESQNETESADDDLYSMRNFSL